MKPSVAIVLPSGSDSWRVANVTRGFVRVAEQFAEQGYAVDLILPPDAERGSHEGLTGDIRRTTLRFTEPAILAGPGSASLTASLKLGHQLWRYLRSATPDILIGPLVGGVLQPSLMSRALREALCKTVVAVLGETTTVERLKLGDIEPGGPGALVDTALESTTARLADIVIGSGPGELLAASNQTRLDLRLPSLGSPMAPQQASPIQEIVYVGPASNRHGTPAFLAEIERLSYSRILDECRVTFLGPWRDGPLGVGKEMLGRRARDWNFTFTQRDETRLDEVVEYLRRPGVLAVFPGSAPDDAVLVEDAIRSGVQAVLCEHHPLTSVAARAAAILPSTLRGLDALVDRGVGTGAGVPEPSYWPEAFGPIIEDHRRTGVTARTSTPKVSLCITHRERAASLGDAVESATAGRDLQPELIVTDTGSGSVAAKAQIERLSQRGAIVILAPAGTQQGVARNLAVQRSTGDVLVFLDDDNIFLDDGLSRLAFSVVESEFDIVVTNLRLYDEPFSTGRSAADLVFLGEAGSAGLIFNGFGDANFAMRRDSFLRVGGFAENDSAAFDWLFLARASTMGLKIGVLQHPAIGYARNISGRDTKWRTRDLEGPRRYLLELCSADSSIVPIVATIQSLTLPLMD